MALELIEVAATVITAGHRILVVWNEHWGAFSLPMTKLRRQQLGLMQNHERVELWSQAALRTVGECLGRTTDRAPKLLLDVNELRQSDRSGAVNHYHCQVFWFDVESPALAPRVAGEWLSPDQVLDEHRQPLSATARSLVTQLQAAAAERGVAFPPRPRPDRPRRSSEAAVAIIRREEKGQDLWLAQWNKRWQRYYLVGGHRHTDETPEECLKREVHEELDLTSNADYTCEPIQDEPLQYTDWSVGYWQDTDYTTWPFRVTLKSPAMKRVNRNPANRWLTKEEILCERCHLGRAAQGDQPVSPTMKKLLRMLDAV